MKKFLQTDSISIFNNTSEKNLKEESLTERWEPMDFNVYRFGSMVAMEHLQRLLCWRWQVQGAGVWSEFYQVKKQQVWPIFTR
jgi:hypothetical protein